MGYLVLFGALIILSGVGVFLCRDDSGFPLLVTFTVVFSILFGTTVTKVHNGEKPQAIDVYRGRTTLQITYQDSIPIDSLVIFK